MMSWRFRRRELEEEMRFHREQLQAEGRSPAEAERAFGNQHSLEERSRAEWGWLWLDQLAQDLRHAARQIGRAPGYAAATVAILALAIGAGAALFSVFNAVLVEPLPYARPDRLVMIEGANPLPARMANKDVTGAYAAWTHQIAGLDAIGFYFADEANFNLGPEAALATRQVRTAEVSPGFLRMMGAGVLGAGFQTGDDASGRNHLVILGAILGAAWGSPATALGRTVKLNGVDYRVLGVAPPGFDFPRHAQAWIPIAQPWRMSADPLVKNVFGLATVGRMRAGVTPGAIARELADNSSVDARVKSHITVTQLQARLTEDAAPALWLLLAATGVVLLIAAANVANLQLARTLRRRHEFHMRAALGASRGRLVRQHLAESLALALPAALLGCAAAWLSLPALRALVPAQLPLAARIQLDLRVLFVAVGAALAATLLAGLAPALDAWRRAPVRNQRQRWRAALSIAEVALAVTLLAAAGLMLQSLWRLSRVNLGFRPQAVLTAKLALAGPGFHTSALRSSFLQRLQERLAALPGVTGAAIGNNLPLNTGSTFVADVEADGRKAEGVYFTSVSPGYFRTLGIPLLAGRDFTGNPAGDAHAVIVSQGLAAALWPGQNAIGRHVPVQFGLQPSTVVGEVADTRLNITDPARTMYSPLAPGTPVGVAVVMRVQGDPTAWVPALRNAVTGLDPDQPVADVAAMPNLVHAALAESRFRSTLLGLFAALAAGLSLAGLAAVISFTSILRRHEFGVRMALGARPAAVAGLVLRQGFGIAALGIAIGLGAALAAGHALDHFLYGVSAHDPATLAVSAALLGLTAMAACWWPARRAAHIDPLQTLRRE